MKKDQTGVPVITHRFASEEIRPGDTEGFYPGRGPRRGYEGYHLRSQPARAGSLPGLFGENSGKPGRELSGFLYLNTAGSQGLAFTTLTLQVEIQDRAGNISRPVSFPLAFNPRAEQENPPLGVLREEELAPILISLDPGQVLPEPVIFRILFFFLALEPLAKVSEKYREKISPQELERIRIEFFFSVPFKALEDGFYPLGI